MQETGLDTVDANRALGLPDDCREYTSVTNILANLGVKSIHLMVRCAQHYDLLLQAQATHAYSRLCSSDVLSWTFWSLLQTNNPRKIELLRATGVQVTDRIPCIVKAQPYSQDYLKIKQTKMAHDFDGSYCYWNHDGTALLPGTQLPAQPEQRIVEQTLHDNEQT